MIANIPLKRVARVQYGLGQPPKLSDHGIPILRATNITRGKITETDLLRAKLEDLPTERAPLLAEGEILVVRSGAYTGDSARVTGKWVGSAPGYDLRLTPQLVDSRYLAHSLLSSAALDQMKLASSRAAQPHLNAEELGGVQLWIPPLDEQRRIADFLDAETARIDALIGARRRQVSVLDERLDSFRENLFGTDVIDGTPTPLMHLTDPYRPIVYGIVQAGPEIPEGVPYIKTGDLKKLHPSELSRTSFAVHEQFRRAAVHPGDIVMAMRASIGAVALVPPELPEANLTQGTARIAAADGISAEWLLQSLQTRHTREQCDLRAVGSTFRTLNIWDLRRIVLTAVSSEHQQVALRKFGALQTKHHRVRQATQRQLALLAERRTALITAAVTGQFDVSTASGRNVTDGVPT
ncbi:hypothetical protein DLE01_36580 [Streptomyces sp. FT05W]|nr:restriction endonuclease subunit S [Streptomyces sp. FT05W]PWS45940.1 hypothetical protein DLE01_36580 [Streptomyces sp. FT05W]